MSQTQPPQISTFVQSANPTQDTAKIRKIKTSVQWLARSQIFLAIFCFIGGIAEAATSGCSYNSYSYSCHYTIGQGIWCSIFPFIAGIFGILASSKTATKTQIRLHMGFSITGAIFMMLMVLIECSMIRWYMFDVFRTMQVIYSCVASLNAILLVVSACFGCCLGCNCRQSDDVMYVAYTPTGNYPAQSLPPGMTANPQMVAMPANSQMVAMPANTQMVTMPANSQMMAMPANSQMMAMPANSQMMAMPSNPQMMVMNASQMQPAGFTQQGFPIMYAQPQFQQVVQQQAQPTSSTSDLPEYQETETKSVPE